MAEPSSGGAEEYVVNAASGPVGAYLTGKDGLTLYTFKADSANTSTCTGSCAQIWPPFVVAAAHTLKAGSGVTATLNHLHPPGRHDAGGPQRGAALLLQERHERQHLYGQGVGGSWFVAAP